MKQLELCLIKQRISKKERNYKNEPNRHSGIEHYNNGNSKFTIMVQKKFEQAEERIRKYKVRSIKITQSEVQKEKQNKKN